MPLRYSIVMAVFNKAALTRHCLSSLRATIEGAGDGEVIVIDNASSDETPQILREFPWVRAVRNEENLGFARANNQGAAMAGGRFLALMNNDMEAHPGWLQAMLDAAEDPSVGAVGAKLLFPDGTIQHAGVGFGHLRFGSATFLPRHEMYRLPSDTPLANVRRDLQCVTAACLVTPAALFAELGGLDEGFWNGNEDVDYCLRVRAKNLRVVYEPNAVLTHFESQSGVQRFRRVAHNIARLSERWGAARVECDAQRHALQQGIIRRELRSAYGAFSVQMPATPGVTVLVHGSGEVGAIERDDAFRANFASIARVAYVREHDAVAAARAEMEVRGDRYVVLLDDRVRLRDGWLDELICQVEFSNNVAAATYSDGSDPTLDANPLAADARCTLLSLRQFPQHWRLADRATLDDSLADFLLRAYDLRLVTRGASRAIADLPERSEAMEFIGARDPQELEAWLQPKPLREPPLVSIVTLSWNALEYTKLALESIRAHTRPPYEVIVVDNGSGAETTSWLRTLDDVQVIFNERNRGFAAGTNQGLAAARGEYVVILNNDVLVTEGWLEGLVDAFDRVPGLGISAVRSNRVAGEQVVLDALYPDIAAMHAFARRRRETFRQQGYVTDRAIGLCLCIDRRVIEEIGGIDEQFGVGNFEDDDFCLRARAAGYRIYVCNDVFIHHFGSRSFVANNVPYAATMTENGAKFARKWNLGVGPGGYDSRAAIARGFDRTQHYVPLPIVAESAPAAEAAHGERAYRAVFGAVVTGERDWNDVGAFVRRYARAFDGRTDVLLAIAAQGELDAARVGGRVARALERLGVDADRAPDIDVTDEGDFDALATALAGGRRIRVNDHACLGSWEAMPQCSPSALRRLLEDARA